MKKIIAMSVVATGMLFASSIGTLGVTQDNNADALTLRDGGKVSQGQINAYGDFTVGGSIVQDNDIGIATVEGNSTVEQGSVTIINSTVALTKTGQGGGTTEINKIGNTLSVTDNSTVTQGQLKLNAVSDATIITGLKNEIQTAITVSNHSELNQGKINLGGSVAGIALTITELTVDEINTVASNTNIDGKSSLDQGGMLVCTNTVIGECE